MEIELFTSKSFSPCRDAERIWRTVASERRIALTVVDVDSPDGQERAERLRITVVPAISVGGRLLAIGVQTIEEARELVATMPGANP